MRERAFADLKKITGNGEVSDDNAKAKSSHVKH